MDKNKVYQIWVERDGHKFVMRYTLGATTATNLIAEISKLVKTPDNPLVETDGFDLVNQVAEHVRVAVATAMGLG